MAKAELKIEAKLNVSDETAAACVVLLNMYLKLPTPFDALNLEKSIL